MSTKGTADEPAVFINYPGEKPVIDGNYLIPNEKVGEIDPIPGKTADSYSLVMIEGGYITFSRFEIIRSGGIGITVTNYANYAACHHITVEKISIPDCRHNGIWMFQTNHIFVQHINIYLTGDFVSYAENFA